MIMVLFLALHRLKSSITIDNKNQIHLVSFYWTAAMYKVLRGAWGVVGYKDK